MAQEEGDEMSTQSQQAPSQYKELLSQFEEEVEQRIADAYLAEGYADERGEPSDEAMREATFQIIVDRCVANSKAERSRKALTKGDLYSLVFPSGPTDDEANSDPVKEKVLAKLASAV